MRISGGNLRGRRLAVEAKGIRPTPVRVREALYDILTHGSHALDLTQTTVLDAFAGTGALGLEALSRGATHVTFMDTNPAAVATLKDLIIHLGIAETTTILRADATNPPSPAGGPCQLVLLDPPYAGALILPAIAALDTAGWLHRSPTLVVEYPSKKAFPPPEGFDVADQRVYGKTTLVFLHRTPV